jgi:hypothetical protein
MLTKGLLDRESPSLLSQLYEVFKIDFEKQTLILVETLIRQ